MNASAAFLLLGSIVAVPGFSQESLVDWTMRHEGFSDHFYLCPAMKPTIGYGHRVYDGENFTHPLTTAEAKRLLLADLQTAQSAVERRFPEVESYPTPVKFVLVALTFQVGPNGAAKFVKFGAAVRAHDYTLAASELRDSTLMTQCPRRTSELAAIMESAEDAR